MLHSWIFLHIQSQYGKMRNHCTGHEIFFRQINSEFFSEKVDFTDFLRQNHSVATISRKKGKELNFPWNWLWDVILKLFCMKLITSKFAHLITTHLKGRSYWFSWKIFFPLFLLGQGKHAFREDWVSPFNELRFGRDLHAKTV